MYVYIYHMYIERLFHPQSSCSYCMYVYEINSLLLLDTLFFFPLLLPLLFSPFSFLFLNAHFLDLCSYIALLYYTEYVYIITTGEHVSIVHTVHSY